MAVNVLTSETLACSLAVRDLSDPASAPHALQLVADAILQALSAAWCIPVRVHRASPIVSLHDNYERLRYPPEATARDARDTRYVGANTVLRTSASAMIPPLLERVAVERDVDDVLLAPVGLVYRRDAIDRLHVGEPHQMDLRRIRRNRTREQDLEHMIRLVAGVIAPGAAVKTVATEHPYTLSGREIYALVDGRWVEIGECGVAHPEVLREAGLPPKIWSGLAMGIGLDRAHAAQRHRRHPFASVHTSTRARADGGPGTVSAGVAMPAVRRDLLIAATPGLDSETLGDRVREQLGDKASAIEDLTILSQTPMEDFPPQAVQRIGIRDAQVNLLIRLVLRHPTATLADHEANMLRDDVYAVVHEGSAHQWAARRARLRAGRRVVRRVASCAGMLFRDRRRRCTSRG